LSFSGSCGSDPARVLPDKTTIRNTMNRRHRMRLILFPPTVTGACSRCQYPDTGDRSTRCHKSRSLMALGSSSPFDEGATRRRVTATTVSDKAQLIERWGVACRMTVRLPWHDRCERPPAVRPGENTRGSLDHWVDEASGLARNAGFSPGSLKYAPRSRHTDGRRM
jgi:hypothetical protein